MTDTILTAAAIAAMAGVEKTHFLNDNAKRLNKSLGDAVGLTDFGVHLIEVPPGCASTEHHVHYVEDECCYVLSGTGTAVLGEERFPVGPGDFIGHPKGGDAHSLENDGDVPLVVLVVGARAPHDVADYPRLQKRIYRAQGRPWDLVDHAHIVNPGGSVGKK